jgi:hypothetical protein
MPGGEGDRKQEKREFHVVKFIVLQDQAKRKGNRDESNCKTVA